MRWPLLATLLLLAQPASTIAEVSGAAIASRAVIADGHAFGATGPYEQLVGRIEFAIDPSDPHNNRIADLVDALRGTEWPRALFF